MDSVAAGAHLPAVWWCVCVQRAAEAGEEQLAGRLTRSAVRRRRTGAKVRKSSTTRRLTSRALATPLISSRPASRSASGQLRPAPASPSVYVCGAAASLQWLLCAWPRGRTSAAGKLPTRVVAWRPVRSRRRRHHRAHQDQLVAEMDHRVQCGSARRAAHCKCFSLSLQILTQLACLLACGWRATTTTTNQWQNKEKADARGCRQSCQQPPASGR